MSFNNRLTIGFIIYKLEGKFFSHLWPGAAEIASEKNINLIYYSGREPKFDDDFTYQHTVMYNFVNKSKIDGLLLASSPLTSSLGFEKFKALYRSFFPLPMVSIGIKCDDIPSVIVDNKIGIKQAMKHLIECHKSKKIVFIKGIIDNNENLKRYQAYIEALEEYNIPFDEHLVIDGNFQINEAKDNISKLIRNNIKFDAVIAANDEMALGAISALKEYNIKVPEQVAVIGFDDLEEVRFFNPPLTSIRQNTRKLVRKSTNLLIDMINKKQVKKLITLPTELIIRQSCGCISQKAIEIQNSGKNLFELLKTKKMKPDNDFKILNLLKNTFNNYDQYTKKIENNFIKLINILDKVIKSNFNDNEINTLLYHLTFEYTEFNIDINIWNKIINILRKYVYFELNEYNEEIIIKIETLIQMTRVSIKENILIKHSSKYYILNDKVYALRSVIQNIITAYDLSDVLNIIAEELPKLNIKSCYLSIYDTIYTRHKDSYFLPDYSYLVMAYNENGKLKNLNKEFNTIDLIPEDILPDRNHTLLVTPLFFKEFQIGFILFEITLNNDFNEDFYYEPISNHISSAIMNSKIFEDREKTQIKLFQILKQLEESHTKLEELSITDELTGVLNRRGFFNIAEDLYNDAVNKNKNFLIIYADLDNLKKINDKHGHTEGDFAIKKCADILKMSLRKNDIIGRVGGDEFIIYLPDTDIIDGKVITEKINNKIEEYNSARKKTYKIGISTGIVEHSNNKSQRLDDLIAAADRNLYKEKLSRKSC